MTVPACQSPQLAQRLAALRRAQTVRVRRAELKRELHDGRPPVPVLQSPPEFALKMTTLDYLLALPRVGRGTAAKWLRRVALQPSTPLGRVTDRQRRELARLIESRA